MKKRMLLVFSLTLCLLGRTGLQAKTTYSAEEIAVRNLRYAFESYAKDHGGRSPSDWKDIERYLSLETLNRSLASPIQEKYTFLKDNPKMPPPRNGHALLIGAKPMFETIRNQQGRFVIWMNESGQFEYEFLREDKAKDLVGPDKNSESEPPDRKPNRQD